MRAWKTDPRDSLAGGEGRVPNYLGQSFCCFIFLETDANNHFIWLSTCSFVTVPLVFDLKWQQRAVCFLQFKVDIFKIYFEAYQCRKDQIRHLNAPQVRRQKSHGQDQKIHRSQPSEVPCCHRVYHTELPENVGIITWNCQAFMHVCAVRQKTLN